MAQQLSLVNVTKSILGIYTSLPVFYVTGENNVGGIRADLAQSELSYHRERSEPEVSLSQFVIFYPLPSSLLLDMYSTKVIIEMFAINMTMMDISKS